MNANELIDLLHNKERLEKEKGVKALDLQNKIRNCFELINTWLKPMEEAGVLWFTKENDGRYSITLKPTLFLDDALFLLKDNIVPGINIFSKSTIISKVRLVDDLPMLDSVEFNKSNFIDFLARTFATND